MIKVFVGDPYLCMKALAPLICDIDSYSYRESTQFTDSEVMFLCGMPLFGTNTLLYKTDCIDANDTLLSFLEGNADCNLYIITRKITKGRKLFNKFTALDVIEYLFLDQKAFVKIFKDNCKQISDEFLSYILKRCGLNMKDSEVLGQDVHNWAARLSLLPITKESIDKVVPQYKTDNVWLLKDQLLEGNSKGCLEIADTILKNKGQPIFILSALLGDIRIALKLSYFKNEPELLSAATKAMGTTRKVYCRQTVSQLSDCYDRLLSGISRCKTGYLHETEFKTTLLDCLSILNNHYDKQ